MRYDDYIPPEEIRLIQSLKCKNRMEKDQIIFEYERKKKNDTLRNDSASKRVIRTFTK